MENEDLDVVALLSVIWNDLLTTPLAQCQDTQEEGHKAKLAKMAIQNIWGSTPMVSFINGNSNWCYQAPTPNWLFPPWLLSHPCPLIFG